MVVVGNQINKPGEPAKDTVFVVYIGPRDSSYLPGTGRGTVRSS